MYSVPKIKRFNTITQQAQKSWRSNLSSDSKRNIILQDITQNLIIIKDDLISFFENNKEYLFPRDNEEYIYIDSTSSIIPAEELLYKLIDILKNDDFISRLEEASSTIDSLSKQLEEAKNEIKKYNKKRNYDSPLSSYRSEIDDHISKELINKLKEKNLLNQKISKDYDNLMDEFISGLTQKMQYEQKIKNLEENLKTFQITKIKNEELIDSNKQIKDEIFLTKNELNDLKKVNNKLYEENIKIKDELQKLYKLIEFKNKEYLDLEEKNKNLLKDNYTCNMEKQRAEEKLKLYANNLKQEKEKNKEIIDDLEMQINEKEEKVNDMRKKIKNNISSLIEENKGGNLKFILDEINNKLKVILKGQIICCIPKFNREIPISFYHRKKYKIISNIIPDINDISENNYKPMTSSKNNKICEINNFNLTYKKSKNEYEFDCSGSSKSHSNNSISHSSFRLDKLYEQANDSFLSNSKSVKKEIKIKFLMTTQKTKKIAKSLSQNIRNYLSHDKREKRGNKVIRRAITDIKGKFLKKNKTKKLLKINSFGFDVESIKEEKDEDNMSINNFDISINSKNKNIHNFSSMSDFLVSGSVEADICRNVSKGIYIINHVEDFLINRLYSQPKNVKLNVKQVIVRKIIHVNKNDEKTSIINNNNEGCYIF